LIADKSVKMDNRRLWSFCRAVPAHFFL